MTKQEFLARMHQAKRIWDETISTFSAPQLLDPATYGDWSLKDLLAHITWYESQMVHVLNARVFESSPLWDLPLDERNAAIHAEIKGLSLEDVLQQSREVYAELDQLVNWMEEEEFNDPRRFPGMPLEWQPWEVLASNTYEHYEDHSSQLRH